MIRKSGDLLRCVFHQLCVFMVLEELLCLQKLRLQQSIYRIAAAFLFVFRAVLPQLLRTGNSRLPTGHFHCFSGSRCLKAHRLPETTPIFPCKMTFFISGGAKCGKSALAQDLSVALSKDGKHYYVATMISTGSEDDERIHRHLADRDGMGFETVECFKNILDCLETADADGSFLVDSVTALLQNSLFPVEKNYELDLEAAKRCSVELVEFAGRVRHAVFVSDYIYSDAERYSESTERYRKCLADIDRRLARVCDTVVEVSAG